MLHSIYLKLHKGTGLSSMKVDKISKATKNIIGIYVQLIGRQRLKKVTK
jgi:hypothetical protein